MKHFTPTLSTKDTSANVRGFVKENMGVFWDVFKPLAPYFVFFTLIDALVPYFFFDLDPETGRRSNFTLGQILSAYFTMCLMISWHRVVIHGADRYEPVNPFRPQKSDLGFIGMAILLGLALVFVPLLIVILSKASGVKALALIAILFIPVFLYVMMRVSFYFPSKATGNGLSLGQAFRMTKGYVWKMFLANFLAIIRLYFVVVILVVVGGMLAVLLPFSGTITGFVFSLPILLYFGPLIAVIGVTVLSNYYQYVMQHQAEVNEPVVIDDGAAL